MSVLCLENVMTMLQTTLSSAFDEQRFVWSELISTS